MSLLVCKIIFLLFKTTFHIYNNMVFFLLTLEKTLNVTDTYKL